MNIRKAFTSKSGLCLLAAVLIMAILLNLMQFERVHALEAQVSAAYEKAFFETVSLMDGIDSNLEKLMVSASGAKEQELLGVISRQADSAQDNLSMLPAGISAISGALKFVNQLGDYAVTLSDRLAQGEKIGSDDRELLLTLHASCAELNGALTEMSDSIQRGESPFSDAPAVSEASLPLNSRAEPDIEYPSLLYDGPFSDGRQTDHLAALGSTQYTAEQAVELARTFIGSDRVLSIKAVRESTVPVPCYEIEAHVHEGELDLAVTKQGGQVVYMLCDEEPEENRFSQAELIDLAAIFLKSRGYPQVSVSYWEMDDNLLTVNFAAVQDGVILYPDLIKVQMSAATGLTVGIESLNYLANHVVRSHLEPTLSESQAKDLLGPLLEAGEGRLCVIPTDTVEALCYEFSGTVDANRYLVYIDAHTGQEREIYRVIEDEDGQLAV